MVSHTVYFTGMMVFTLTSQMYHRISVLVPVLVRVPEYLSTSTRTSMNTMTFELTSTSTDEYQKFSTRVLRVRVPSTSTPALPKNYANDLLWHWGNHIIALVPIKQNILEESKANMRTYFMGYNVLVEWWISEYICLSAIAGYYKRSLIGFHSNYRRYDIDT